jgi:hypothetical protein
MVIEMILGFIKQRFSGQLLYLLKSTLYLTAEISSTLSEKYFRILFREAKRIL